MVDRIGVNTVSIHVTVAVERQPESSVVVSGADVSI